MSTPALHVHDGGYGRGEVSLPVHCLPALAHVAVLAGYTPLDVRLDETEGLWYVYTDDGHRRYTIGNDTGALLAIEYRDEQDEWASYAPAFLREAMLRRPHGMAAPHLTSVREADDSPGMPRWEWRCTCGAGTGEDERMFYRYSAEGAAEAHREESR